MMAQPANLHTYEITIDRHNDVPLKLHYQGESIEAAIAMAHDWLRQSQPTITKVERIDVQDVV